MEMQHSAPEIPNAVLVLAVFVLIGYAIVSVIAGFAQSGAVAALMTIPIATNLPWLAARIPATAQWTLRLASLLVPGVAFATLTGHLQPLIYWHFLVPLALFGVWPLWLAITGTAVFLVGVAAMGTETALGMVRHQLVPMALLTTALTVIFVYLREYKAAQLAPLRRTDSLTLASTRDYLETDLRRELRRGEREGTPVTLVALQLDEPEYPLPGADRNNLIVRLGRLLHRTLRDFDSYYRTAETTFFLVLPITSTQEAVQTAETLRQETHRMLSNEGLKLSVSAGVAGMNVADDTHTMEYKALEALRRARKQGGNRILTHADIGGYGD